MRYTTQPDQPAGKSGHFQDSCKNPTENPAENYNCDQICGCAFNNRIKTFLRAFGKKQAEYHAKGGNDPICLESSISSAGKKKTTRKESTKRNDTDQGSTVKFQIIFLLCVHKIPPLI